MMGFASTPAHLAFQISEEAGIEEVAVFTRGSSGGISCCCAVSRNRSTDSSATGMSFNEVRSAPQVRASSCQRARRMTWENESLGPRRAALKRAYASRPMEMVFVAMHSTYMHRVAKAIGVRARSGLYYHAH